MKSIKFVFAAAILSLGLSSCVQSTEEVNVKEDMLEAPADETSDIPADEELEDNIQKNEEMDSDEEPIMDTMQ